MCQSGTNPLYIFSLEISITGTRGLVIEKSIIVLEDVRNMCTGVVDYNYIP